MKAILFNKVTYRKNILLFSISLFFSTLVFAQPSNDNCNNATTLTSNTSCNNAQYRLKNAFIKDFNLIYQDILEITKYKFILLLQIW